MVFRRAIYFILICLLFIPSLQGKSFENNSSTEKFKIELPEIIIQHISSDIVIHNMYDEPETNESVYLLKINNTLHNIQFDNGVARIPYEFSEKENLHITIDGFLFEKGITPIPLWMSILPTCRLSSNVGERNA